MKNKKYMIFIIALIAVLAASSAMFAGCSKDKGDKADNEVETEDVESPEDEDYDDDSFENGIVYDEEEEDADIVKVDKPESDFYGEWTATSDMAKYLYGNIDITIEEGGKWKGNITETDFTGTWTKDGTDVHVVSDDGDIDFLFAFTENGTLVMQRDVSDEGGDEDYVNTVLTKKEK